MEKTTKTLCLPLKKNWFHLIKMGFKKEEYRLITPYWIQRLLLVEDSGEYRRIKAEEARFLYKKHDPTALKYCLEGEILKPIDYELVRFSLGYPSGSESDKFITKKIKSISIGFPLNSWAPAEYRKKLMFVLKIS